MAARRLRLFASKALSIWAACLAGVALADGIYWVRHHHLPDALTIRISIAGSALVAVVGTVSAIRRMNRRDRA
ncbi:hypothetical protein [Streptomyces sp. NPDC048282]|uniref:hypothetical protein n=1 Tax=unclassified Streptomyces TaxID=2593676 RepID=UPI00371A30BC